MELSSACRAPRGGQGWPRGTDLPTRSLNADRHVMHQVWELREKSRKRAGKQGSRGEAAALCFLSPLKVDLGKPPCIQQSDDVVAHGSSLHKH